MLAANTSSRDVLVAGAGPTGLMLACELRLAGCSVLVLEKSADRYAPMKAAPFGVRGLSVSTIEKLDRRELLDALRRRAATRAPGQRHPVGHFAGIDVFRDRIAPAAWTDRLPTAIDTLAVDIASIEEVLADRATSIGVDIRRGYDVDRVDQTEGGVVVQAGGARFRGRWLVGCDGGRSAVRKLAGIGFAGTEPEFTGYSVQVSLRDPAALEAGRNLTAGGVYIYAPPDTLWIADFDGGAAHRSTLTREHVDAVLRKVSGVDVAVTALHLAATWTDRAFQASDYRRGRILLAGDAAHVHSPLGGQGLNLGIGDAMNLGWKLAAVVQGRALPALLDSYEHERRPVAADVLERSRAQVALLRPDPGSRALEAIMSDLIETADGATYFAERVTGIGVRYALGDAHPLVGRSVPDIRLADGSKLDDHLRSGRGVLLDVAADPAAQALVDRAGDSLVYLAGGLARGMGVAAMLVRPDGIVAWAGDDPVDVSRAGDAVDRWFASAGPDKRRPCDTQTRSAISVTIRA